MKHNPLEEAKIIHNSNFHQYSVQLKNYQKENIIEETNYIWYLKADEIENGQNILQSIMYENNTLTIKFSGPEPTNEIIEWIDQKIERLLKKINNGPTY